MRDKPQQGGSKPARQLDPLLRNQLIGGICAGLVVVFALVRIFVLQASTDGTLMNLMSIANAVLSLVVLTSAVRIMLFSHKEASFEETLAAKLQKIEERYGALIYASDAYLGDDADGAVYSIATNTDAVFTVDMADLQELSLEYVEKFAFSPNFMQTRHIYYYVNHCNMAARAALHNTTDLELTARLLARDIAVAIQRAFPEILAAHALDIYNEKNRAVVTITIKHAETAAHAESIASLVDYLLFLHYVAT